MLSGFLLMDVNAGTANESHIILLNYSLKDTKLPLVEIEEVASFISNFKLFILTYIYGGNHNFNKIEANNEHSISRNQF